MMKRSIFLKIFGSYFLLIIALSGLIVIFSSYLIRHYQLQRTEQELTEIAAVIKGLLKEAPADRSIDQTIKALGRQVNTRITLVEPSGRVIADSQENLNKMENHRTRTEIAQAFEGQTGRYLRFSETLGQEMLYIAVPVYEGGAVRYVVRVSKFLKDIKIVSGRLNAKIAQTAAIVLVIALIAAFIFARTISRPVGELTDAIRRVAGHDFSARVLLKGRDELKQVADSFNTMTDEMQGLFAELTRQKEELNSIITSLQEGLLVLDRDDRVVLANKSLDSIAGRTLETGKFYWEEIREPSINELIKKVRSERQNLVREITVNDMAFLCSASFLKTQDGIVIVFHDITEIRRLEKIKSDFVLNVSHELRTPLTSIKGYAETMDENSLSDENRHYLATIRRNTERLINIVGDLLTLAKLEEKGLALDLEPVSMPLLIERVLKIFENQARAKGFSLKTIIPAVLPPVMGDPFKLEQVFINLLDNAIKYTGSGEITIEVDEADGNVITRVKDAGPGIPQEHISRIFERFYVVDTSRSKNLGGTGLGLSIVKHIVLLHNGKIHVESVIGKGSTFIISLPALKRPDPAHR
jgi:two-component system, OmpR family, phosphate regulon sensor histidine kinase PhoR